jgi:hypothetical protein
VHLDELNEKMELSNKRPIVEVLDPAKPPVKDCLPKTIMTMLSISSFFGLFFYCFFLPLFHWYDSFSGTMYDK